MLFYYNSINKLKDKRYIYSICSCSCPSLVLQHSHTYYAKKEIVTVFILKYSFQIQLEKVICKSIIMHHQ